jgi:hypothetical protein
MDEESEMDLSMRNFLNSVQTVMFDLENKWKKIGELLMPTLVDFQEYLQK